MLCADIVLTERFGLGGGALKCLLCPQGQPVLGRGGRSCAVKRRDGLPQRAFGYPAAAQHPRADSGVLQQDAEQQMLRADIAVPHIASGGSRLFDGVFRPLGEFLVASHLDIPSRSWTFSLIIAHFGR